MSKPGRWMIPWLPGRGKRISLAFALIACWFVNACGPATAAPEHQDTVSIGAVDAGPVEIGTCRLSLPELKTDAEAIAALLNAEGVYVVEQDIVALLGLWMPDGRITDAKHTPAKPADDLTWSGADAIRHRYVRWVFPGAPAVAQPVVLAISISGKRAVVTSTTRIGNEVSPAGDRWLLVKKGGCWLIQELVFNLEPL